jgi:hypothetical protein
VRPNLFRFATSELSQDAFLCWLLSWADAEQGENNPHLHLVGKALLTLVYRLAKKTVPADFSTVEAKRQVSNIDILCTINGNTAILIEDKVDTEQHSNQLARGKEHVFKLGFTADNVILVYIQTGDQSDYCEVVKHGYLVLKRRDLLNILESDNGKAARLKSDILDDFSNHLRQIEDDVQSFLSVSPSKWSSNSWKGFYTSLQNTLQGGNWKHFPNPAGGVLGFYWYGNNKHWLYIELEQKKFCFKIQVDDAMERHAFRQHWCDQVILKCPKHGIKAKHPRRFGSSQYITIAILDQEFPVVGSNGLIDMDETLKIIQSAQSVLDDCLSTV